jgi:hypothetical protein
MYNFASALGHFAVETALGVAPIDKAIRPLLFAGPFGAPTAAHPHTARDPSTPAHTHTYIVGECQRENTSTHREGLHRHVALYAYLGSCSLSVGLRDCLATGPSLLWLITDWVLDAWAAPAAKLKPKRS